MKTVPFDLAATALVLEKLQLSFDFLHEAQARPFFPSQTVFLVLHREHGVGDAVSDASASDGSESSTGSAYFTLSSFIVFLASPTNESPEPIRIGGSSSFF